MTDADLVPQRPESRRQAWLDGFSRTRLVLEHVGKPDSFSRLHVVVARSGRLDRTVGPGWVAVGDAAMAFDPLSGRGIVHAIESGQAAAEALLAWYLGDCGAVSRLAAGVALSFDNYCKNRLLYYGRECRWPDAAFWSRRHHPGGDNSAEGS
jgi:flavin-dependent dehydrogenase